MIDRLVRCAEEHDYQRLFIQHLNWSRPDHPPVPVIDQETRRTITATNVSSYKGLRVWVCNESPNPKLEVLVDRAIATTSTDRLLIFHNDTDQIWRWPVRRHTERGITTRLTRHRHRAGETDAGFTAKLAAIQLPTDRTLDPHDVLSRVRAAFDVESHNETKHASKLMVKLYTAMERAYPAGHPPQARDHQISVTLARILFLMFGDDTDMWMPDLFRDYMHAHTARDGSDIAERLTQLFTYVDTPETERADPSVALDGFPYINGGIFSERITLPTMQVDFRDAILEACDRDWAAISPAIFGSMFQSVRDAQTRRELGEHYTSEENILKTLNPLFLDDLRAELAHIRTLGKYEADRLRKLREKLGNIKYLDPACGCGNFIIVAYRELRSLELEIMERLQAITKEDPQLIANVGLKVGLDNFYGIEIDEWPARIAETAMFLMDRQCDLKLTERLGLALDRLPIKHQATIRVGNATRLDWQDIVEVDDDLIIAGNPPFVGHYTKTASQTAELKDVWGVRYDGYLDYVTAWHAKALITLRECNARWAFVTTNSITQGLAVPALFRPIYAEGWHIQFAHATFPWTSEATGKAAVHCVIIGFSRTSDSKRALFIYDSPKLPARKVLVDNINAYLLDSEDILVDKRSKPLPGLPPVLYGSKPADGGHLQVKRTAVHQFEKDPIAAKYLRRFIGADELLNGTDRWCLWMVDADPKDLSASALLRERIAGVRETRAASSKASTRAAARTAHLFTEVRQPSTPYLAIPQHVSESRKYFLAARYGSDVICGNANFTAQDPDGFLFAIISSSMFITWQRMIGGRIKSDLRFSNTVVWNNFPLPSGSSRARRAIVEAGQAILSARACQPGKSLDELYEPGAMRADLIAAHDHLDQLVDRAFGAADIFATTTERQLVLFARYRELNSG